MPTNKKDAAMQRALTDADVQALVAAFADHHTIDPDQHAAQHAFVQAWMDKEKRKQERYEKIKEQVGGWVIIAILGAMGSGAYKLGIWIFQHGRVGQ